MPVKFPSFKPGLILVRPIVPIGVGYHFGIWATPDQVFHAAKGELAVCTSPSAFAAGRDVSVSAYSFLNYEPEVAIKRARDAVGTWKWDLVETNCEAFVLWCINGEMSRGMQAELIDLAGKLARKWLEPQPRLPTASERMNSEVQRLLHEHDENLSRNQEQFQRKMAELEQERARLWAKREEDCRTADEAFERMRAELEEHRRKAGEAFERIRAEHRE